MVYTRGLKAGVIDKEIRISLKIKDSEITTAFALPILCNDGKGKTLECHCEPVLSTSTPLSINSVEGKQFVLYTSEIS